jgi:hypothetical protein
MQSKCDHLIRAERGPTQRIPYDGTFFFAVGRLGQPSVHLKRFAWDYSSGTESTCMGGRKMSKKPISFRERMDLARPESSNVGKATAARAPSRSSFVFCAMLRA